MVSRLTLMVWLLGMTYMLMRSQSSVGENEHHVTWTEFTKDILAHGEVS